MAIRPVTKIGNPVLRKKARTLDHDEITSVATRRLIEDMIDTMRVEDGIGIAAPQIGESVQVAVVEIEDDSRRYPNMGRFGTTVFINPVITVVDPVEQAFWEGCLSVPDLRGVVHRPRKIRVDYVDVEGCERQLEAEGFPATVLQHELDHLQGILFVDRVRDTTTLATIEEYRRFWMDRPIEEALRR